MGKLLKLWRVGLFVILTLGLFSILITHAAVADNIEDTDKWAWGTNIGWLNFDPSDGGITVFSDHLEGYAWSENIGWISLGTYAGGGNHTYPNTAADNYGINRDLWGNLSGYAWSTNAGWINFNPTYGGVTVDPSTGEFRGYAWAENLGWIHFKGGAGVTAYGVVTSFRSFLRFLPVVLNGS